MVAFLLVISVASCKKYLNEKSDKSLVQPGTVADLQGVLDHTFMMNERTPGFGEVYADDYFVTQVNYNAFGVIDRDYYNWNVTHYNFPNDWANAYLAIYNANYCLEKLEDIPVGPQNEQQWQNVKGAAHFYRGYYFLLLSWEFSKAFDATTAEVDLGIVLRLNSDFNQPSRRSSVKASYEQVIQDLMTGIPYLPELPIHPMRPSRASCYGALARTYLSMRKYDSAYKYSDLALRIKSDLVDYNSAAVNKDAIVPFQPFNKEIIFYSVQSGTYGPTFPPIGSIDTLLTASYEENDLRKFVFFRPFNGYSRFKGNYTATTNKLFSGIATDEMLLTKSECLARLGNTQEALDVLNGLLEQRWKTGTFNSYTAANSTEALKLILAERRKELVMRCLRWIDIKRLNKEGAAITPMRMVDGRTYTLPPGDSRYALPLPQDIINRTGIEQN